MFHLWLPTAVHWLTSTCTLYFSHHHSQLALPHLAAAKCGNVSLLVRNYIRLFSYSVQCTSTLLSPRTPFVFTVRSECRTKRTGQQERWWHEVRSCRPTVPLPTASRPAFSKWSTGSTLTASSFSTYIERIQYPLECESSECLPLAASACLMRYWSTLLSVIVHCNLILCLFQGLLQLNPAKRLTCWQALHSEYFTASGIAEQYALTYGDWNRVYSRFRKRKSMPCAGPPLQFRSSTSSRLDP